MTRQAKTVSQELLFETEWRREVAARVAALDAGGVETTSWDEVRKRLHARLGERLQD
jgi:hypothetical protein